TDAGVAGDGARDAVALRGVGRGTGQGVERAIGRPAVCRHLDDDRIPGAQGAGLVKLEIEGGGRQVEAAPGRRQVDLAEDARAAAVGGADADGVAGDLDFAAGRDIAAAAVAGATAAVAGLRPIARPVAVAVVVGVDRAVEEVVGDEVAVAGAGAVEE